MHTRRFIGIVIVASISELALLIALSAVQVLAHRQGITLIQTANNKRLMLPFECRDVR